MMEKPGLVSGFSASIMDMINFQRILYAKPSFPHMKTDGIRKILIELLICAFLELALY